MTTFDERKKAFESKFAHDEQLKFKVEARANKLLGIWAAGLLGLQGDEAVKYAREVIESDFDEPGQEDVFKKVSSDLGANASESEIRKKMNECLEESKRQVAEEE